MDIFETIKKEYELNKISFKKLGEKYNIHYKQIERKAKKEKWVKSGSEAKNIIDKKTEKTNLDAFESKERYLFFQEKHKDIPLRKVNELKEELGGHYSSVDEPLIVMYADLYQKYLIMTALISEDSDLVQTEKGVLYTNPRFNNYLAIIERLAKIGDRLGLSIASRKRMGIVMGAEIKQTTIFDFLENIPSGPGE